MQQSLSYEFIYSLSEFCETRIKNKHVPSYLGETLYWHCTNTYLVIKVNLKDSVAIVFLQIRNQQQRLLSTLDIKVTLTLNIWFLLIQARYFDTHLNNLNKYETPVRQNRFIHARCIIIVIYRKKGIYNLHLVSKFYRLWVSFMKICSFHFYLRWRGRGVLCDRGLFLSIHR